MCLLSLKFSQWVQYFRTDTLSELWLVCIFKIVQANFQGLSGSTLDGLILPTIWTVLMSPCLQEKRKFVTLHLGEIFTGLTDFDSQMRQISVKTAKPLASAKIQSYRQTWTNLSKWMIKRWNQKNLWRDCENSDSIGHVDFSLLYQLWGLWK